MLSMNTGFAARGGEQFLRGSAAILLGSLVLAVSARVQVPFWPVPMTMQTFAVIVIAMTLGARLGGLVVFAYLIEGLLGLPVFANTPERGAGLAYFFGPTGGYLAGFVVAAVMCGWLAERGGRRTLAAALAVNALGTATILGFGAAWLAMLVGPAKALSVGVMPFIVASVFKIVLGGGVVFALDQWRHRHARN